MFILKFNRKAFTIIATVFLLFLSQLTIATDKDTIERRSKLDIIENYYKNDFKPDKMREDIEYSMKPNTSGNIEAGKPMARHYEEALNLVNFIRFMVGLPDDIVINEEFNEYAQYASLINSINGKLSHHPAKPHAISDDMHKLAYEGASSSNIGFGYPNIKFSIMDGYMADDDSSNIDRVGHRRWILNPPMKEIGFGYANNFTATYVFDRSRNKEIKYDYISWPNSGYMPIEYFSSIIPWSINLGQEYDTPNINMVEVDLKNIRTGDRWDFNSTTNRNSSLSFGKGFFNVENGGYGMGKCIIFRPKFDSITIKKGDVFEVVVKGIYKDGKESPLKFTVDFFSLKGGPSSWALKEVMEANELSLIAKDFQENYTENINRLDFCHLIVNLLEVKNGQPIEEILIKNNKFINESAFGDTQDRMVLSANALGIISGKGNNIFDPYGLLTRQEVALILMNTAKILGKGDHLSNEIRFSDEDKISLWAKDAITFVSSNKDKSNNNPIMGGGSGNKFYPLDFYTRQEAFITLKRLLNS